MRSEQKMESPFMRYTYIPKYKVIREEEEKKAAKKNLSVQKKQINPDLNKQVIQSPKHSKSPAKTWNRLKTEQV